MSQEAAETFVFSDENLVFNNGDMEKKIMQIFRF